MPKRREGPVRNRQTGFYFLDEIIGFSPNKHRIRISLRTQDPEKARWLWEQEYRRQWQAYYGIEDKTKPKPVLFSDICRQFIDYERDIRRAKEWRSQRGKLRHVYVCWGDIALYDIRQEHFTKLDTYLKSMQRPRSNSTINHYFALLKTLFNYAIKEGKYHEMNPISKISPYIVDGKRRAYSTEEIIRIIQAAERIEREARADAFIQKACKRIVLILLYSGMRFGEALNLRWENIEDDRIVLKRTETKQRREKVIPLTDGLRETLASLRDNRRKNGYVLPLRRKSGEMKPTFAYSLIRKIREYSGIPDFVFHGLRHTAATILVSESLGQGVGLPDVMKILGHSELKTTMKYLHSDFGRMKTAMKTLEEKVGK